MNDLAILETDIQFVKGIGEKRAKLLKRLGVFCLRDLLRYFPFRYEDRREFRAIGDLQSGEDVCIRAVVGTQPKTAFLRKGMEITRFSVFDETGTLEVTFFNQRYAAQHLTVGEELCFFGRIKQNAAGRLTMLNPVYELPEARKELGRIIPVYRTCAGLSQGVLRKAITQALTVALPEEDLPLSIRQRYQLCSSDEAYPAIHFPKGDQELANARRRMIFEELLLLCLGLNQLKGRRRMAALPMDACDLGRFEALLPFSLTGAQRRCAQEIMEDLMSGTCMNRLLQGDVGSGKTAVAAAAAWMVYENGMQAALMAPTELLAEQHYQTLSTLLRGSGMRLDLLTGSMTAAEKRSVRQRLASGETDLCIGTHALLSEGVEFQRLGLIIPDEQHRFGVRQRAALAAKGEQVHVLVMSATPIPRTLALILYGDLDVSLIDELPPGRKPVETYVVEERLRPRVENFIRKLVKQGRQIYIVCPLIEQEENSLGESEKKAAESYARQLQTEVFPELRIGLVHGRMKPKEKDAVMRAFTAGALDILVATTVIEVGMDVPNAALMLVENAERFGLSQLHQLRGRVGRGEHQSYCVLMRQGGGEATRERLRAMARTGSGFEIAEEDLRLRGPGDFFGSAQHGVPAMGIASQSYDMQLLKSAQQAAQELLDEDPGLYRHPALQQQVRSLFSESGEIFN